MLRKPRVPVELPAWVREDVDQDEEWCWVEFGGSRHRLRLHDYRKIYSIPGLYEDLFCQRLRCDSPRVVCGTLMEQIRSEGGDPSELIVLDIGAGNGMMGEELIRHGVREIDGIDIITEAAEAARRDRPQVYRHYYVEDLSCPSPAHYQRWERRGYNCLTTVAALGFDDIPPEAFVTAYNLIRPRGWVAFNIKDAFLYREDPTGFSRLIRRMVKHGFFALRSRFRYRHRYSISGKALHYLVFVGIKLADIPEHWVREFERTTA